MLHSVLILASFLYNFWARKIIQEDRWFLLQFRNTNINISQVILSKVISLPWLLLWNGLCFLWWNYLNKTYYFSVLLLIHYIQYGCVWSIFVNVLAISFYTSLPPLSFLPRCSHRGYYFDSCSWQASRVLDRLLLEKCCVVKRQWNVILYLPPSVCTLACQSTADGGNDLLG